MVTTRRPNSSKTAEAFRTISKAALYAYFDQSEANEATAEK